jgi:hypothetical protein
MAAPVKNGKNFGLTFSITDLAKTYTPNIKQNGRNGLRPYRSISIFLLLAETIY